MTYRVELTKKAQRQFNALPVVVQSLVEPKIRALANDPRPNGVTKLKGKDQYRIRTGDYRVVYEVEDAILLVAVVRVAHRSRVYKEN